MKLMPPGSRRARTIPATATGAHAIGTVALGSIAIAAVAVGALAVGALSIGRLFVGRARIRRLEIDEIVVRRVRILEQLTMPPAQEAASVIDDPNSPSVTPRSEMAAG